ncbi:hypothetical protein BD311DRAFT_800898 [Dichomitus squalens]|uniref:Uncharacterized protein n=1 Tax=Dichomitus squalens TaxID=114155 RepID=A0A4Q9M7B1_9APHY|nr:hypothetical protein BD311DRAFT_800898 [Dichomitus squalens]
MAHQANLQSGKRRTRRGLPLEGGSGGVGVCENDLGGMSQNRRDSDWVVRELGEGKNAVGGFAGSSHLERRGSSRLSFSCLSQGLYALGELFAFPVPPGRLAVFLSFSFSLSLSRSRSHSLAAVLARQALLLAILRSPALKEAGSVYESSDQETQTGQAVLSVTRFNDCWPSAQKEPAYSARCTRGPGMLQAYGEESLDVVVAAPCGRRAVAYTSASVSIRPPITTTERGKHSKSNAASGFEMIPDRPGIHARDREVGGASWYLRRRNRMDKPKLEGAVRKVVDNAHQRQEPVSRKGRKSCSGRSHGVTAGASVHDLLVGVRSSGNTGKSKAGAWLRMPRGAMHALSLWPRDGKCCGRTGREVHMDCDRWRSKLRWDQSILSPVELWARRVASATSDNGQPHARRTQQDPRLFTQRNDPIFQNLAINVRRIRPFREPNLSGFDQAFRICAQIWPDYRSGHLAA